MNLEIGQFAERAVVNQNSNSVVYQWADPRDILWIEIYFTESIISNCLKSIYYWQANWPKNRLRAGEKFGSGRSGWKSQDDWYKGMWRQADSQIFLKSDHIRIEFQPINQKEFIDEDYSVKFRRTLKIRFDFIHDFSPKELISNIKIYSISNLENRGFKLITNLAKQSAQFSEYRVEIFNGYLVPNLLESENIPINASVFVEAAICDSVDSYDDTIITIFPMASKPQSRGFSFSIAELYEQDFMLLPDFGLAILKPDCIEDFHAIEQNISKIQDGVHEDQDYTENLNGKCVYDRVFDLPERRFDDAMGEFTQKSIFYGVIGCEGVRSKAAIHPTGEITIPKQFLVKIPRKDTPGVFWNKEYARIRFHSKTQENNADDEFFHPPLTRSIDSGFYPIIKTE